MSDTPRTDAAWAQNTGSTSPVKNWLERAKRMAKTSRELEIDLMDIRNKTLDEAAMLCDQLSLTCGPTDRSIGYDNAAVRIRALKGVE